MGRYRGGMTAEDIDAYLATVPEPQRATLQVVRERLRSALPDAEECITYGVPTFREGGRKMAGFAAAKNHCSYFPMSGEVLPRVADLIEGFSTSRGTLRFPVDQPLSMKLVRALVAARRDDIAARGK